MSAAYYRWMSMVFCVSFMCVALVGIAECDSVSVSVGPIC